MEDDRILEDLRASWDCQPPADLRERVLDAASREIAGPSRSSPMLMRPRMAAALACVLVIAMAYVVDGARVARLSGGGAEASAAYRAYDRPGHLAALRAELNELMGASVSDTP